MKYKPEILQQMALELGSWNAVVREIGISSRTLSKYKKDGLIFNLPPAPRYNISLNEVQEKYDEGLSLRELEKYFGVSKQVFKTLGLKTRNKSQANKFGCQKYKFSEETLTKLSRLAKERGLGGYRPHPNRGMRYKGIWFDSRYEIKVAQDLDKNAILWNRPSVGFVWNEKGNKYYPDFYLKDYDVYLDPKNDYLIKKDTNKIVLAEKMNNIKVLILTKDELTWDSIKKKLL